ncbi:MAG: methyltransferase, partial [Gammaproteobacteria bacterium]
RQDMLVMREVYDFSNCKVLVDVGGGQGFLLGSLLDRYRELRAVLFDLPEVVAGIDERLAPHIASERCGVVGGNFLERVPAGGNVYLLKRVLSHCSDEDARTLLSNIHAVIAPRGRLLVADPGPGTLYGASFDLLMLVLLGGGLRSDHELRGLFAATGFNPVRAIETPGELRLVEAAAA